MNYQIEKNHQTDNKLNQKNLGMNKKLWSKSLWDTFHYIALGYPMNPSNQDKINYKMFYENLYKVIPCQECTEHYKKNFEQNPIDNYLENKDKLFEWTVNFHNNVNKFTNGKQISVEIAKNIYLKEKYCFPKIYFFYIFLLIILIFVLLLKCFWHNFMAKPKIKN
jgi:hypothetical protein